MPPRERPALPYRDTQRKFFMLSELKSLHCLHAPAIGVHSSTFTRASQLDLSDDVLARARTRPLAELADMEPVDE
jgi:hypothetical protein